MANLIFYHFGIKMEKSKVAPWKKVEFKKSSFFSLCFCFDLSSKCPAMPPGPCPEGHSVFSKLSSYSQSKFVNNKWRQRKSNFIFSTGSKLKNYRIQTFRRTFVALWLLIRNDRQTCSKRTFWGNLLWSIFVKMKSKPTIYCRTCQRRTFLWNAIYVSNFINKPSESHNEGSYYLGTYYLTSVLLLTAHNQNYLCTYILHRRPYV